MQEQVSRQFDVVTQKTCDIRTYVQRIKFETFVINHWFCPSRNNYHRIKREVTREKTFKFNQQTSNCHFEWGMCFCRCRVFCMWKNDFINASRWNDDDYSGKPFMMVVPNMEQTITSHLHMFCRTNKMTFQLKWKNEMRACAWKLQQQQQQRHQQRTGAQTKETARERANERNKKKMK